MLKIKPETMTAIIEHARRDAPLEACGYLAEQDGIIVLHVPLANQDRSGEHFSFDPAEQFRAARDIRSRGLVLRGVYHSHPQTPARPSEEDIRLAYDPQLSSVIISLQEEPAQVRSFRIRNGQVEPEEMHPEP
jgi:proteasome lid subunit RPN8/RPN11